MHLLLKNDILTQIHSLSYGMLVCDSAGYVIVSDFEKRDGAQNQVDCFFLYASHSLEGHPSHYIAFTFSLLTISNVLYHYFVQNKGIV